MNWRSLAASVIATAVFQVAIASEPDESLFGEPALEEVLYERHESYRFPSYNSPDLLTQHNDNNRSGASHSPGVNQHSIRSFRRVGEIPVDPEAVVTAQPLYAASALVSNIRQGVVIVATSKNQVYAVRPDGPFDQFLWGPRQLGSPLEATTEQQRCNLGPNAAWSDGVQNAHGYVGIEATPVIDLSNNRVLVGYKRQDFEQRLAAINLNNGRVVRDVPVQPAGVGRNWSRLHRNRASLLLADGIVYLAFSSLCEGTPELMHGSIVAFDARTLDRVGDFQVTDARTDGGGIWQGGSGPAADTEGNIYFVTGNRRLPLFQPNPCLVALANQPSDPDALSLSNSVVRLHTEKRTADGRRPRPDEPYLLRMNVETYFTPYRRALADCMDLDLGSSGPLLIPETPFVVAGGKEGLIYVMNRASMGGFAAAGAPWTAAGAAHMFHNVWHGEVPKDDPNRDHVQQKFQAGVNTYDADYKAKVLMKWPHIHGTPAFARFDAQRAYMFVWPEKDALKRYRWDGARFILPPAHGAELAPPNMEPIDPDHMLDHANGMRNNGMPGGMVSVNIDHSGPLLGVVLASVKVCDPRGCGVDQSDGVLRAYDPFTMQQVWKNSDEPQHKRYWFSKFVAPTVAAGKIFLATASGKVIVYGPAR